MAILKLGNNSSEFSGSFSGSFEGDGSQLTNLPAGISSSYASTASYVETSQTASYVLNAISSSYAESSSYATTASYVNPLNQNVDITGNITSSGNIQMPTQNASIDFINGSILSRTGGSYPGIQLNSGATNNNIWFLAGNNESVGGSVTASFVSSGFLNNVGIVRAMSNTSLLLQGGPSPNDANDGVKIETADASNVYQSRFEVESDTDTVDAYFTNINGLGINKTTGITAAVDITGDLRTSTNITASGNISASGNIYGEDLYVGGTQFTDITTNANHFGIGLNGWGSLVLANITASGDISSSGDVYGVTGSFQHVLGDGSDLIGVISSSYATTASYVETSQTASYVLNAISSSYSSYASSSAYATAALSSTYATTAVSALTATTATNADTASYVEASNIVQPFTNITATGNISASGGSLYGVNLDISGYALIGESSLRLRESPGIPASGILQSDAPLSTAQYFTAANITSSGNISASGDIIARDFSSSNAFHAMAHSGYEFTISGSHFNMLNQTADKNLHFLTTAGTGVIAFGTDNTNNEVVIGTGGHITASGNISSSGLIIGKTLEVMGTADFNGPTTMGTDGRFSYGDWINSQAETSIDSRFKNIIELREARVPAPWTVTSIHHATEGQQLILLADPNLTVVVTIQDNANINLNGTTDFDMNAGDTLTLVASSTLDTWYETGRMVR